MLHVFMCVALASVCRAGHGAVSGVDSAIADLGGEVAVLGGKPAVFKSPMTGTTSSDSFVIFQESTTRAAKSGRLRRYGVAVLRGQGGAGSTLYVKEFADLAVDESQLVAPSGLYRASRSEDSPIAVVAGSMGASSGIRYRIGVWGDGRFRWFGRGANTLEVKDLDGDGRTEILESSRFLPPSVIVAVGDRLVLANTRFPALYDDYVQGIDALVDEWKQRGYYSLFQGIRFGVRALIARGDLDRAEEIVRVLRDHLDVMSGDGKSAEDSAFWLALCESSQLRAFISVDKGDEAGAIRAFEDSVRFAAIPTRTTEEFSRLEEALPIEHRADTLTNPEKVLDLRAKARRNVLAASLGQCGRAEALKFLGDYYAFTFRFEEAVVAYQRALAMAEPGSSCGALARVVGLLLDAARGGAGKPCGSCP